MILPLCPYFCRIKLRGPKNEKPAGSGSKTLNICLVVKLEVPWLVIQPTVMGTNMFLDKVGID